MNSISLFSERTLFLAHDVRLWAISNVCAYLQADQRVECSCGTGDLVGIGVVIPKGGVYFIFKPYEIEL